MRLYLVTDRALLLGKELLWTVREAAAGGVTMVQLREKECATREFVELARAVKGVLEPFGVPLMVNDRVDVALAAGADGVHVGQSDMSVADVRRLLPAGAVVGLSVESEKQLIEADGLPIDYVALSPVFSTPTKTDTVIEWGLEGIRRAKTLTRRPVVAIGGVNLSNAAAVRAAGADSICVVSAICSAVDPRKAAKQLHNIIL